MAFFDSFSSNVEDVTDRGCKGDPEVSKLVNDYGKQAEKADHSLKEKQAQARRERKAQKSS